MVREEPAGLFTAISPSYTAATLTLLDLKLLQTICVKSLVIFYLGLVQQIQQILSQVNVHMLRVILVNWRLQKKGDWISVKLLQGGFILHKDKHLMYYELRDFV